MTMPVDPKQTKSPVAKPKTTSPAQPQSKMVDKKKSKERRILELLEGDEFDTADFELLTDVRDAR